MIVCYGSDTIVEKNIKIFKVYRGTILNNSGGVFMAHNLVRTVILPDVINKIQEKYNTDENKALDMFYTSHIGKLFSEDESGLYGQSPNYIFSLFLEIFDESKLAD